MELWGQKKLSSASDGAKADLSGRKHLIPIRCGIFFFIGLTLSLARVLDYSAPLGMAFVASAGIGAGGVSALAGAAVGYLAGGPDWGIRYVAAAVLVYTAAFVFHETKLYRQQFFMPTVAGAVMAATGYLGSFSLSADSVPLIARLFLETCLAFGGCFFFREALSGTPCTTVTAELRHNVSLMILAACLLMALARFAVLQTVSVGRTLALLFVMTCAMKGGMLTGAAVGTVLGLAMDASVGGAPFFTMAYAFSGLLSGVFGKNGRVVFLISFALATAIAVVLNWRREIYIPALFETFFASVIFMLLPPSFLAKLALLLQYAEKGKGEAGLRRFTAGRIRGLSDAYSELYETVEQSLTDTGNDENIASIFDRAANSVCASCRFKNRCWNADYMDTLSALNDATPSMLRLGLLSEEMLPGYFKSRCVAVREFISAVNAELKALSYRKQLRNRLSENRAVAWGQFQDMSAMLSSVASELGGMNGADPLAERRLMRFLRERDIEADIAVYRDGSGRMRVVIESGNISALTRMDSYVQKLGEVVGVKLTLPSDSGDDAYRLTLLESEPLAVSVGIAAMHKRGETVSGDKGCCFKTDYGVLCVILSDGMGSGDEAAEDSSRTVAILEKFLRSGADPALAMKLLNSVMLLRGGDSWGYATVDLMCVDLFSGETCFYKYGAAPSYVKNGKLIRQIKGESLPVGLNLGEGRAPDIVRMKLKPGCCALIASDGVISDDGDQWIRELLSRDWEDMRSFARAAVKEAQRRGGEEDDVTVLTVRVEQRI